MAIKVERKSYRDKKTGETRWTETYYLFHAGRRISTGKTTKQEARKWAGEYLAQNGDVQRKARLSQKRRKAPLVQHLDRWRQELGNEEWASTKVARVRNLLAWCGFRLLTDLDARAVGRELDRRVEQGVMAKKTANGYITEVCSFGDWLVHEGIIDSNPFRERNHLGKAVLTRSAVRPADRRKRRRYLRLAEFKSLIAAVEQKAKTIQGIPAVDRVMAYRLAASSGLRRKELGALRSGDFDFDRQVVHLAPDDSKNGEGAIQPLPDPLIPDLKSWLETKPAGLLLPLAKKRTAEMLEADLEGTGIPVVDERGLTVDFHALRSTYAAGLALNGVPLPVVSHLMRHSTVDLTVQLYIGLGLQDYSEAMAKLPDF